MKEKIRELALEMGFSACGFTHAGELENQREPLRFWLDAGYHAGMSYMENHFEKRLNPSLLVEGAKTVVSLIYNYYPVKLQRSDAPQIAKYAYGEDYHTVFKEKMFEFYKRINEIVPVEGRVFTDSAPLLERSLAVRAGLGWIGKHSLLINRELGTFFFIGELVLDIELAPDHPFENNHCGSCRNCIDACPTSAIGDNCTIDSNLCLSYHTIEYRGEFDEHTPDFSDRLFGCDICQDVCPWNRRAKPTEEERFAPHPDMLTKSREEWGSIDEEEFRRIFRRSAVKRAKYKGIRRNIDFINRDSQRELL